MRYKTYVKKINDTLTKYKTDIDTLDSMYLADKEKLKATANEMKDKWTDSYIEQYCRDNNPDINYKKKNELLCRIDKGGKINSNRSKMTLNAYFDYWMDTFAKSGRKATTCTNYKSYYCTYVKETIGKKIITKITKADCQKIINEMIESGKKHSTMANLKSCLNIVFECAIDDDVIVKNPAKNLQIPQTESKKRKAIEEKHIKIFMNYVRNSEQYSYSYSAFVILFNLGVRVGDDDDKIRLNQRKPSKYKGLRRFGPEKNLQRINKFMKERPIFYKNLIQMKENIRFYLRCFYCITKVMILQFNSENRTELARNG